MTKGKGTRTVVFLDLDGTLWEAGVVPDSARAAIRAAQEKGHKFLTNTGRARSEVPDLSYLGLDGYCFAAGAEVLLDGKVVVDERIDASDVRAIMHTFDSHGLNYNLEGGDVSWMVTNDEAALDEVRSVFSDTPDTIMFMPAASEMTEDDFGRIHKLFYHGGPADYAQLVAEMPAGVTLTDLGFDFAEATRSDVSKATAMEAVRAYLGADWRTMAIGDSDNDLPMLRAADVSVCMGNGNENAKAAATWVTTGIHEDGLANALAHFGMI